MFKINLKVQFIFLVVSLFFVGLGINDVLQDGLKSGVNLFKQISPIVPFAIFSIIFIRNIYMKKEKAN
jgi:hypothetical protein